MILLKILTFYIGSILGNSFVIWLISAVWLGIINLMKANQYEESWQKNLKINEEQIYELVGILAWNLLKCISITIDKIKLEEKSNHFELKNFLGYSLYFPTLFFGPFMIYGVSVNQIFIFPIKKCW